jgi:hypothetical protein
MHSYKEGDLVVRQVIIISPSEVWYDQVVVVVVFCCLSNHNSWALAGWLVL